MSSLSLVIGYRNREQQRVERCLDSLANQNERDFTLTFIDYGSDSEVANKVSDLVSKYSFATYYFNDTRGQFWNRSHALNTGVRRSPVSDYVVTTDIDLIFPPSFIGQFRSNLAKDRELHVAANDLPEKFRNWGRLFMGGKVFGSTRSNTALGLVQGMPRAGFEQIGGFDEFYRIWGAEDEDLNLRLSQQGLTTHWLELNGSPVYHQWHPSSSKRTFALPARWQEYIVRYKATKAGEVVRNQTGWGNLVGTADRPTIAALTDDLPRIAIEEIPSHVVSSVISEALDRASEGDVLRFTFKDKMTKTIISSKLLRFVTAANKLLDKANAPLMFTNDMTYYHRYQSVYDYRDAITYFLIAEKRRFSDYYLKMGDFDLELLIAR